MEHPPCHQTAMLCRLSLLSPDGMATDEDIARARTHLSSYLSVRVVVTETEKEIRFETARTEEMVLRAAGSGSQGLW